jgi:hypothetical protein
MYFDQDLEHVYNDKEHNKIQNLIENKYNISLDVETLKKVQDAIKHKLPLRNLILKHRKN